MATHTTKIHGPPISERSADPLHKDRIIPEIIDRINQQTELSISYKHPVANGTHLKPRDAHNQPTVSWTGETNALYTLAMVDPDAPSMSNPEYREWRHWLVTNIKGNDISTGDVLSTYMGPAPPSGTSLHRYVFLLYKQPEKLNLHKLNDDGKGRAHFQIKEFARMNNLGDPIAAKFFFAQHE